LDEAIFAIGEMILESAKARISRNPTGRLKRSGYVSTLTKSNYIKRRGHKKERKPTKSGEVIIAFSANHSHLLEFGTKKMGAKPYIRPALDELKSQLGDKFAVEMTKSLAMKLGK
jgi:HK97 gp10 family phage protein